MLRIGFRGSIVLLLGAFLGRIGSAAPASGGLVDLGTLGGSAGSATCTAINRNGDLVGTSSTPEGLGRAFLWTKAAGLVSLGTLGGSQSSAADVSDDGVVVGMSYTIDERPHAFRWTSTSGMVDLTPDAPASGASAVSQAGHVLGQAFDASFVPTAFLWTPVSGMQSLGLFNGWPTQGVDVNDSGEVVGSYESSEGPGAFYWSAATGYVDLGSGTNARMINRHGHVCGDRLVDGGHRQAFRWSPAGGFLNIGTLGGTESAATALNHAGEVVGSAQLASGETRGFHWSPASGLTEIPALGGSESAAEGISPDGATVVGWSALASGLTHAFRWTLGGAVVDLGALSGGSSRAFRVNNNGKAFGTSFAGFQPRAVVWNAQGAIKDVGTLEGGMSEVAAVGAAGHVAGHSFAEDGRLSAFVWTNSGGMVGLGDLGGGESRAVAVNASGHVAGNSLTAAFEERAFYWSPGTGLLDLGDHGGALVTAAGLNASNTVLANLSYKNEDPPRSAVLLWSPSGPPQLLGPLAGGRFPSGAAIDGQGRVVGACLLEGTTQAVAWAPGALVPEIILTPAALGGTGAGATHLTDTGWTAGYLEAGEPATLRAWIRDPQGTPRLLEGLESGFGSMATSEVLALAANGDAVGYVRSSEGFAVPALWRAGELVGEERKLTLPAGPAAPGVARGISALGKVAGALEEGGAFLWTPAGGLELLGTLGGARTEAATIGEGGHVAGTSTTATGERRAFVWKRGMFP